MKTEEVTGDFCQNRVSGVLGLESRLPAVNQGRFQKEEQVYEGAGSCGFWFREERYLGV